MVYRIYVEKKKGFDHEAQNLLGEVHGLLGIQSVTGLRILNRYDVEGVSEELFRSCIPTVFSEPPVDDTCDHCPEADVVFAVEYLPGQFDQRAASASECIQLISQGERPTVRTARVYLITGNPTETELTQIKKYVINPVEAREASLSRKDTLQMEYPTPSTVETLTGFCELDEEGLANFVKEKGLAMDEADIAFCQNYFRFEKRDPTITEIRMIDTYWSDHCRHTTFGTILDEIEIRDVQVKKAFDHYLAMRKAVYAGRKKNMCLMDLATIGAKYLASIGKLKNLDESEEINACTVKIKCDVDGEEQDWLYLFKNETHNHPTEIEPFGGAATCIGGAIRDPLSGRSYVYQAMRVTGAGDPLVPVSETMAGKLPQRKLVTTAAAGYSSYGNQIGLATGQVDELYHPGYVAKRLEIGAVVGAAPASNVRREVPAAGDIVVLLGGATGRDGCGGATGSSKAHKLESLETCGAEVQKGNAPIERKLQRLFRRPEATRLIKRCNDFGAGGVSVAIGELADGLAIDLDAVPKKYEGLDGTELAISESQERMAVVLAPQDVEAFVKLANEENLDATVVATVTEDPRLTMTWKGNTIVNISRNFLNSNGAEKRARVLVYDCQDYKVDWKGDTWAEKMQNLVTDLNVCSKKGLSERFDSTIGAATVLMPFGGKYQLTPAQAMAAKLPVPGETTTCSGMAWGYNPYLMEKKQYSGAYLAVVESVSKLVASGFRYEDAYLTFQEYFERLGDAPERWGKPFAALLGALMAQVDLGVAAIGGKDSMSGSFENLDVPPTLVSFATAIGNTKNVISPEFKAAGSKVVWLYPEYQDKLELRPEPHSLKKLYKKVEELIAAGKVKAAYTPGYGCAAEAVFKMCLGNRLGFALDAARDPENLFHPAYGSFILEVEPELELDEGVVLGTVTETYALKIAGETIDLAALQEAWERKLEPVFPYRKAGATVDKISYEATERKAPAIGIAKPKVIIPVFPGTNCEYDTARAFARAGADPKVLVINNLSASAVAESCAALTQAIRESQIVMLPGGFSGGDEPDGSAKFITAFLRAPSVTEAVHELLQKRDGLMLGICNGFQALIKLGLVPYGEIRPITAECPTLTFNTINRHQSMLVNTRIASNKSPWLSRCSVDEVHTIAISHGEGRFVASDEVVKSLIENGQVATQYVDAAGQPTMDLRYNPNGSVLAIEGITSPDGRVLGKMGHTERSGDELYKNVPGNKYQPLFEGGVDYFKL
ncbi:phosphoribosylformylglycinamidine synthase [Allofournierella massiliensis]|uniref:Phosphoribosylformylglycinamidine synthase n=1 Tax=Allofournierella massiliensis TaxID=1650663 RepID=A0ABT7URT5_9FIRM|nr:phosphoribosylformylglycinamidine synthase [Fournierella massiliensis]MDM8201603.1 phosphoribosylformylglycinamidine synthase [Fournierella massiliensis]